MINRFLCVGALREISISMYQTHIRVRLSMAVNGQVVTVQHTLNRRWSAQRCVELCGTISQIHPVIDGYVLKNGNERIYTMPHSDTPTRLLVSGNVNEWRGSVYFNGQYMRTANDSNADSMSIEIDGQWVDDGVFLNVLNDSPVVFHIPKPASLDPYAVYRLNFTYNAGYNVCENIVLSNADGLKPVSCRPVGVALNQADIDKLLLEYRIISE